MPCRKQNVPIECHICYKKFTKPQGLKTHKISTMHNKEDQKFKCDICMKGFAVWKNFKKLVRNGHVQNSYQCLFCPTKVLTKGTLTRHIARSHSQDFKCDICERPFGSLKDVQSHVQIIHGDFTRI